MVACLEELDLAGRRVNGGDMDRLVGVLVAQTAVLNILFADLARRAHQATSVDQCERYLRLAMRAQSQCRTTCETLGLLKNPPVFARQANVAHNQQVNIAAGDRLETALREEDPKNLRNKLMGATCEPEQLETARLDTGTSGVTGPRNPALAPLGALDRAAYSHGQGPVVT